MAYKIVNNLCPNRGKSTTSTRISTYATKFPTMDWDSVPQVQSNSNFHIPRLYDLDFMAIIKLRIYIGFDCQNRWGSNFTPFQSLFTVKSLMNFQICYPHMIRLASTNTAFTLILLNRLCLNKFKFEPIK